MKSSSHWRAFETAFEVFFALRTQVAHRVPTARSRTEKAPEAQRGAVRRDRAVRRQGRSWKGGGAGLEGMTPEEMAELLFRSLLVGGRRVDERRGPQPRSTATPAWNPGWPVCGTYQLVPHAAESGPRRGARAPHGPSAGGLVAAAAPLTERWRSDWPRDEFKARIEKFRRAARDRRSAAAWWKTAAAEALARSVRKPLPEDIDVMHATRERVGRCCTGCLHPVVPQAGRAPRPEAPARP